MTNATVLVPFATSIHPVCESGLQALEHHGVRVVRKSGCSAIDVARNELCSAALESGADSIMFIDSDIGFDPADAIKLLNHDAPVICGVYAKKNQREMACVFAQGIKEVTFGVEALAPYALRFAAAGFLRIKAAVLRDMIDKLHLPLCNEAWPRPFYPFFQPMIINHLEGPGKHYLAEDFAFSQRLYNIGIMPLADTSIRLFHFGCAAFSWEEAGTPPKRYRSYNYRLE